MHDFFSYLFVDCNVVHKAQEQKTAQLEQSWIKPAANKIIVFL